MIRIITAVIINIGTIIAIIIISIIIMIISIIIIMVFRRKGVEGGSPGGSRVATPSQSPFPLTNGSLYR